MFSLILYWTLYVFVLFWILYSKHNKREVFCGFCAVVMLNSQQAKQLPSTEIQRKDKPPPWLHRELSRHCHRPQLRGDIHVASIDDIYILNEHMITQDRHIMPTESVNTLLSVSCLSENLRKPSLIVERIWQTFSWIKPQKINELELHTMVIVVFPCTTRRLRK